jgi:glycosyltransferase involved in cell wall biosynthesis
MVLRVAVITATYNRASILPRSIESVLSQDYKHLKLLIIDDGSTDGTSRVLEPYVGDPRVLVVRHETNQGVIAARNTALAHLDDDVTYFCYNDSDDMLLPGAISRAVSVLEGSELRYSMLYAWARDAATGEPQGSLRGRDGDIRLSGEITLDDCLDYRIGGDWFQLVRRDLVGSMRYDERAGGGEGILWARILRTRPALLIEDTLLLKDRAGSDRVNRTNVRYDRDSAESRMWIYVHEFRIFGHEMRRAYPRSYGLLLARLAHSAAMAGDGRRARLASRAALRSAPSPLTMAVAVAVLAPAIVVRGATRLLMVVVRRRRASRRGHRAGPPNHGR